jgi:2-polyprenyl-3-methyl-5-hydroxy-6-metoxy-1,4-benzoquinol methylase
MTQTCPLCQSDQSQLFETAQDAGQRLEYRLCGRCGMVFQGSDWKKDELNQFYANDYRKLVEGEDQVSEKNRAIEETRARLLVDWLKAQGIDQVQRHMDIGASTGALIRRTQRSFGAQVLGVELSNSHRAFAEARGLPMLPSLEALEASGSERFDLISLIHVLEHLPDPVGSLAGLRERWLTADGAILLEVPNLFVHNSYEIAHLHAFSQHTLAETRCACTDSRARTCWACTSPCWHGRRLARPIKPCVLKAACVSNAGWAWPGGVCWNA